MSDHPHTEVFRKWNGWHGNNDGGKSKTNVQIHLRGEWHDIKTAPSWSLNERYRIKPEKKKLVPWDFQEWGLMIGWKVMHVSTGSVYLVAGVSRLEMVLIGAEHYDYLSALERFECTNGKPCGKYVEENT